MKKAFVPFVLLFAACAPVAPPEEPINTLPGNIDPFREVGAPMSEAVDALFPAYRALTQQRELGEDRSDSCDPALAGHNTFGDHIAYATHLNMEAKKSELAYVADAYALPASSAAFIPTSLWSHALCPVTRSGLETTLRGRSLPSNATIAKAAAFTEELNDLRSKSRAGDVSAYLKLEQRWAKLLLCLGYVESLTTADTARSHQAAANLGVNRKPAGVKYYVDESQTDPVSRNNIGLFQFSPASSGNVQACVRAWNARYTGCQIGTRLSQDGMVELLGSAGQTFNAFCGATKIRDMFSVQVNTSRAANTHPNNLQSGALKPGNNRCVTPFFHSNLSYNHFGPLQNSTNGNLDDLLSCAEAE